MSLESIKAEFADASIQEVLPEVLAPWNHGAAMR